MRLYRELCIRLLFAFFIKLSIDNCVFLRKISFPSLYLIFQYMNILVSDRKEFLSFFYIFSFLHFTLIFLSAIIVFSFLSFIHKNWCTSPPYLIIDNYHGIILHQFWYQRKRSWLEGTSPRVNKLCNQDSRLQFFYAIIGEHTKGKERGGLDITSSELVLLAKRNYALWLLMEVVVLEWRHKNLLISWIWRKNIQIPFR